MKKAPANTDSRWALSRRDALKTLGGAAAAVVFTKTVDPLSSPESDGQEVVVSLGRPAHPLAAKSMWGYHDQDRQNIYLQNEPSGVAAAAALSPQVLGFGETNNYNWRTDAVLNKAQINGDMPPDVVAPDPPGINRYYVRNFDAFIDLCQQVGAEPSLGVNMYSPLGLTADDLAARAAARVHEVNVVRGLGVRYWQLGGELNYGAYRSRYGDPHNYVANASLVAAAMRAVDPSIVLVGSAAPPRWLLMPRHGEEASFTVWNEILAAGPKFYDHIGMHFYAFTTDRKNMTPEGTPGLRSGSTIADYEDEARWLLSASTQQPGLVADYVGGIFDDGTSIYSSEWNIQIPGNGVNLVQNTVLNALYDADFLLHASDHQSLFSALMYHNMTNIDFGFDLFHYAVAADGTWSPVVGKTVPYYVFEQFYPMVQQASAQVPVRLHHVPTFSGRFQYDDVTVDGLTVRAWEQSDGSLKVAIVNKLNSSQRVRVVGAGERRAVEQWTLAGPLNAIDSRDLTRHPDASPDTVLPEVTEVSADRFLVEVPEYSFNVITVRR